MIRLFSTIVMQFSFNLPGVPGAQSQFTGPSNGICPGHDVTLTCAVTTTNVMIWTVNSGGDEDSCNYNRAGPNTDECGPVNRFMSSRTENEEPNNSSLRVDSVDGSLNGVNVARTDGNVNIIGFTDICVTSKIDYNGKLQTQHSTN